MLFYVEFSPGWDKHFSKFDSSEKERILKKINQLPFLQNQRHLRCGLPYFVTQTGQYRITYEEIGSTRKVMFAGNHKQYEKWLRELQLNL